MENIDKILILKSYINSIVEIERKKKLNVIDYC